MPYNIIKLFYVFYYYFLFKGQNPIFGSMFRSRVYSLICLASLMLFFSNSVVILGNMLFDQMTEYSLGQSDLLENENENENESKVPTPTEEEEEEHANFDFHVFYEEVEPHHFFIHLSSYWDNLNQPVPTEPPEKTV